MCTSHRHISSIMISAYKKACNGRPRWVLKAIRDSMPLDSGFQDRLTARVLALRPVRRSMLKAHRNTYQCYMRRLNVQQTCYAKISDKGHETAIEVEKNALDVLGLLLTQVWKMPIPMGNQLAMESMYAELNVEDDEDEKEEEAEEEDAEEEVTQIKPEQVQPEEIDMDALIKENMYLYQARMRMASSVLTERTQREREMSDLRIDIPEFKIVQLVQLSESHTEQFYEMMYTMEDLVNMMRELLRPSIIYLMEAHGTLPYYDQNIDGELVWLVDSFYQNTRTLNTYLESLKLARQVVIVELFRVERDDPYQMREVNQTVGFVIDRAERTVRLMTAVLLLVGTAPSVELIYKVNAETYDELTEDIERELLLLEQSHEHPKAVLAKTKKKKKKSTKRRKKK